MLKSKFILLITSTFLIFNSSAIAQTSSRPKPSDLPLDIQLLNNPRGSVVTANTIRITGLTTPSLWLSQEMSENKLLENWLAYPPNQQEFGRVDLIVNQQIWNLLDYLERYEFVNRLGNTVRKDNYNLRVFNYQGDLLGTYTCNLQINPSICDIQLNTQYKLGSNR